MPLLYSVFRKWFKSKYSDAIENMMLNSERLTTPYDLYDTLLDLSNLSQLGNNNNSSESNLKRPSNHREAKKAFQRN